MRLSKSHLEFQKLLDEKSLLEKVELCHGLIKNLIDKYQCEIAGCNGLINEYEFMTDVLIPKLKADGTVSDENKMRAIRYCETSYLVWALSEYYKRVDIIICNIKNWGNGEDFNGGSKFRNFEYECHTALRFLEENYQVCPITDSGKPEYLVNDIVGIECKRITMFIGLFSNVLKARQQADILNKPTVVFINLDYLYNELGSYKWLNYDGLLKTCLKITEYALGTKKSCLIGAVFEFVPEFDGDNEGAVLCALRNNNIDRNINTAQLWKMISIALCGDNSLDIIEPKMDVSNRYGLDYNGKNKTKMFSYYLDVIVNDLKSNGNCNDDIINLLMKT